MLTKVLRLKPRRSGILVLSHLKHILVLQRGMLMPRRKRDNSRGMDKGKRRSEISLVNVTIATLKIIGRGIVLCI